MPGKCKPLGSIPGPQKKTNKQKTKSSSEPADLGRAGPEILQAPLPVQGPHIEEQGSRQKARGSLLENWISPLKMMKFGFVQNLNLSHEAVSKPESSVSPLPPDS